MQGYLNKLILSALFSTPFLEPKRDRLGRLVIQRHWIVRAAVLLAFFLNIALLVLMILLPDEDMTSDERINWMIFSGLGAVVWSFVVVRVTFFKVILSRDSVSSPGFLSAKKEIAFSSIHKITTASFFMGMSIPVLVGNKKAHVASMVLSGPNSKIVIPLGTCGFEKFLHELKSRVRVKGFEPIEENLEQRRKDYLSHLAKK